MPKRTQTGRAWMHEHVTDPYVRRAKLEHYRSRSAYKLLEVDARDRLLRPGSVVVDLGAAPGGWSQVAAARVAPGGSVIAVDLLDMNPIAGVHFIRGDFTLPEIRLAVAKLLPAGGADLVISDMAPNISGISLADQERILRLARASLDFARDCLKPGGALLVKAFQGEGSIDFHDAMRQAFKSVFIRKPSASRSRSSEIYVLGRGLEKRVVGTPAALR